MHVKQIVAHFTCGVIKTLWTISFASSYVLFDAILETNHRFIHNFSNLHLWLFWRFAEELRKEIWTWIAMRLFYCIWEACNVVQNEWVKRRSCDEEMDSCFEFIAILKCSTHFQKWMKSLKIFSEVEKTYTEQNRIIVTNECNGLCVVCNSSTSNNLNLIMFEKTIHYLMIEGVQSAIERPSRCHRMKSEEHQ